MNVAVIAFAGCLALTLSDPGDERPAALDAAYREKLAALAEWCEQQGLIDAARQTRQWAIVDRPETWTFALPSNEPLVIPAEAQGPQRAWYERFHALRRAQALALLTTLNGPAADDDASRQWTTWYRALREDPDLAQIRQAVGYERFDGRWRSPYEVAKQRGRQVWDERFGWQLRERLPRYEQGERFVGGRWLPADAAQRQITDLASGWDITTEHFRIRTTTDLAAGVGLAGRLERFFQVFRQLFAPVPAQPPRRHEVAYYATREAYIEALVNRQPAIAISTGYYDPETRTAHFHAGVDEDRTAQYHEVTHQLLYELRAAQLQPGAMANYWAVEAMACYLETYREQLAADGSGIVTLGGRDAIRLKAARVRRLEDEFYIPLAELVRLGREQLQRDERLQMIYSQMAGLAHFFIHYDNGRYRRAWLDYVHDIYTGRDRPETLAERTGTRYEVLDREYAEFLRSTAGKL